MSVLVYLDPDDPNQINKDKKAIAIESACYEEFFLHVKPDGKISSYFYSSLPQDTIGLNSGFIAEPVTGRDLHIGSQMTLRSCAYPDHYLHVICTGPEEYKVVFQPREDPGDQRTHFYFVRYKPDNVAMSIGCVAFPGRWLVLDKGNEVHHDGIEEGLNCREDVLDKEDAWFYLIPLPITTDPSDADSDVDSDVASDAAITSDLSNVKIT